MLRTLRPDTEMAGPRRQLLFCGLQGPPIGQNDESAGPPRSIDPPVAVHQERLRNGVDDFQEFEDTGSRRPFVDIERKGDVLDPRLLTDPLFGGEPISPMPPASEVEHTAKTQLFESFLEGLGVQLG